jgi:hypothetical protein
MGLSERDARDGGFSLDVGSLPVALKDCHFATALPLPGHRIVPEKRTRILLLWFDRAKRRIGRRGVLSIDPWMLESLQGSR